MAAPTAHDTTDVFADIDRMDAGAFASYLADDAVLRFGNGDPVQGREAIQEAIGGFFTTIKGLSHKTLHQHEADGVSIVESDVTYTRHDGETVTVPVVSVLEWGEDRIAGYRIYCDLAPVFS